VSKSRDHGGVPLLRAISHKLYDKYFFWKHGYPYHMEVFDMVARHGRSIWEGGPIIFTDRQLEWSYAYTSTGDLSKAAEKMDCNRERMRQMTRKLKRVYESWEKKHTHE